MSTHTTASPLESTQGSAMRILSPGNSVILLPLRPLIHLLGPWKSTTIQMGQQPQLVICAYPAIIQAVDSTDLNSFPTGRTKSSKVAGICERLYSTLKLHYPMIPKPLRSQLHPKRTRPSSNGWRHLVGSTPCTASAWRCVV